MQQLSGTKAQGGATARRFDRRDVHRVKADASRAVLILPGLGNASGDYTALQAELQGRGFARVCTAQVARIDWGRNAAGLLDRKYWTGNLSPIPTVNWYLDRVSTAVQTLKGELGEDTPISLLAHSAGGWLARVFFHAKGAQGIDRLVCLGSPNNPPPKDSGAVDQTRGILTWVEDNCPGAFVPSVSYTSVAGKWMEGAALFDGSASWTRRLVGLGYQQTCGSATVWGDGIVPVEVAHLEGARQLTLEGVYHSPVGAVEEEVLLVGPAAAAAAEQEASSGKKGRLWYGSKSVVDQWIEHAGGVVSPAPLVASSS